MSPTSTPWPGKRASASGGFTATDLLVGVAVLSLLAALVTIPVQASYRKSRLARCTGNLQQVTRALLGFANDNNQSLPGASPALGGDPWWWYKEQVKRYVGLSGPSSTNDTVFACPMDRGYTDPRPFHQSARFDYTSYCFNGVTLPGVPNIAGWPVYSVKQPARTLLAMEWTAHAPLSWHQSRTGKRNYPFYCDARSVVGFVDGHVNFIKVYYDGYNAAYTQDPIAGYDYRYSGN
jgi:type II secretory pathway pseudopilin PulG